MLKKLKEFNWMRIVMPLSTYYKLKTGIANPVLILFDFLILCIPFSTLIVVLMVNYLLDDVEENETK